MGLFFNMLLNIYIQTNYRSIADMVPGEYSFFFSHAGTHWTFFIKHITQIIVFSKLRKNCGSKLQVEIRAQSRPLVMKNKRLQLNLILILDHIQEKNVFYGNENLYYK